MTTQFCNSSSATVFDIHFLQEQICEDLSTRDIRRCCLVSHNFYQNFSPHLYRTININRKSTLNHFCRQESLDALQRNHGYVLEVSCYFAQIWKILLKYQCFNMIILKSPSLKYRHQNRDTNMSYIQDVIALVQSCQNLRVLEIGYFPYDGTMVELFCKTIRDHDALQELGIDHYRRVACSKVMLILWSGFKLEKLSINIHIHPYFSPDREIDESIEVFDEMVAQENTPFQIRQLMVSGRVENGGMRALVEFFKRCPHLTHLGIPWGTTRFDLPTIRHLDLSSQILSRDSVARLITSCQSLFSFVGGRGSRIELVFPNLVEHCETLQELDFTRSYMSSYCIHCILCSFPNLKVFKLMTPYSSITSRWDKIKLRHNSDYSILDAKDIFNEKKPWVCRDLRVLTLWYCTTTFLGTTRNNGGFEYRGAFPNVLFDQIGQLTELNVLWLGCVDNVVPNPTFHRQRNEDKGLIGLNKLSKLENLQLRQTKEYIDKDTLKEARSHWPSLKRLLIT
ncbi:hypothetical protein BGZ76_002799 [Entomortierella beljakovae]|nr:hypothetical protein BGZ76_002799 [Entomortierella beljakovae]